MKKLLLIIFFFPAVVYGNPFINIVPGVSCSEINSVESSIEYKEKRSSTLDGVIHTVVRREYLGHRSRSFYTCTEGKVNGYTFTLFISTPSAAIELLKNWLPTAEYNLGEPSFNSFVSPYKEQFERDIKEGLFDKNTVLLAWDLKENVYVHLSVNKFSKDYELIWAW